MSVNTAPMSANEAGMLINIAPMSVNEAAMLINKTAMSVNKPAMSINTGAKSVDRATVLISNVARKVNNAAKSASKGPKAASKTARDAGVSRAQGHPNTCVFSEFLREKDAIRISDVIGEGRARDEAVARIELTRRLETSLRPGLQTQPPITAALRFPENVPQHRRCYAFAQMACGGPHRLDLALARVQFLERAATEEFPVFPHAPEGDLRSSQSLERERMHTLWRRLPAHACEMFLEERGDFRAAQIIFPDLHPELIPADRARLQVRKA